MILALLHWSQSLWIMLNRMELENWLWMLSNVAVQRVMLDHRVKTALLVILVFKADHILDFAKDVNVMAMLLNVISNTEFVSIVNTTLKEIIVKDALPDSLEMLDEEHLMIVNQLKLKLHVNVTTILHEDVIHSDVVCFVNTALKDITVMHVKRDIMETPLVELLMIVLLVHALELLNVTSIKMVKLAVETVQLVILDDCVTNVLLATPNLPIPMVVTANQQVESIQIERNSSQKPKVSFKPFLNHIAK